MINTKNNII